MNKVKYAIYALVGISSIAHAGSGGFQGPRSIIGYDVGDTGVLYIKFATDGQCKALAIVQRSREYYSDMLAMTISAYNTGKPLDVYLNGCPDGATPAEIVRMVQGRVF